MALKTFTFTLYLVEHGFSAAAELLSKLKKRLKSTDCTDLMHVGTFQPDAPNRSIPLKLEIFPNQLNKLDYLIKLFIV